MLAKANEKNSKNLLLVLPFSLIGFVTMPGNLHLPNQFSLLEPFVEPWSLVGFPITMVDTQVSLLQIASFWLLELPLLLLLISYPSCCADLSWDCHT